MLTALQIRAAKPRKHPYKLTDGGGLYLYVSAKGAKSWRYDYRIYGKRETFVIGKHPDIEAPQARDVHREARKRVTLGQSPATKKQQDKFAALAIGADTFKASAEEWFTRKGVSRSASWHENMRRWLDKSIYPAIGSKPITAVTPADVLAIMNKMRDAGAIKSAEYARQAIAQVFRFAIQNLRANQNPAREVQGALVLPHPKKRPPLTAKEMPDFLVAIDGYTGRTETRLALRLLTLTFVRKLELVEAPWGEFELDKAEWRIAAERMKAAEAHIVPLSRQTVEALKQLRKLSKGHFLFPNLSRPDAPMSASTLNAAFERIGYGGRFSPHGLRATASTALNEQGFRADVIERQLSHTERDKVRAAYNHAQYLPERRAMMQHWADYLDGIAAGGDVVPLHATKAA